MTCTIRRINEQTWEFDEGGVRFFLLAGNKEAVLLDSGMETHNARELAQELTDLPLALMNTHADRDHLGSNHEFEWFYMHPAELSNLYNTQKSTGTVRPVWDGQKMDLGDRELEIIHIPGHTPGSIAVLDRKYRMLFTGDPIQDGRIFMFGVQREMHAYRLSLKKLDAYRGEFDTVWPCHGTSPVSPELIDQLYDASADVMEGKVPYTRAEVFGNTIRIYDVGCAQFMLDDKD
ncbi:MAG: MBL fold metallo-hydrolase [Solobacterium sp.]|nr:MBL fold metallo-hydrolase [Solobacterium sp.]